MIRPNNSFHIERYFHKDGLLSEHLPNFESRKEQLDMACAVNDAFENNNHLAVEAGTGVGKSFAYLVPVIHKAATAECKIIISTFTITLQEQLINKDIPALSKSLDMEFVAALAKGRANYLCLRRLNYALKQSRQLFIQIADELEQIMHWKDETSDGSVSDLPFVPSAPAWDAVKSEHGNCPARRCKHFQRCFYRRAKRDLETADIIIANHALLFSDLVLKESGYSLLPEYNYVVIDEAHNIETVAQDHFGIDISNRRVSYLLDKLYNNRTKKGLLAFNKQADKAVELIGAVRSASKKFFKNARLWYEEHIEENGGRCHKNFIEDNISGQLKLLRTQLAKLAKLTDDADEKLEINRYVNIAAELLLDLQAFLSQQNADYVYWIELSTKRTVTVRLKSAPLNVGPDVKRTLFDMYNSVVMTSATLSTDGSGRKEGFNFFAHRIGLENFKAVLLGSPYDYAKQVTMYIERNLPEPNDYNFLEQAAEAIKKYTLQTQGRAFVLFTSYNMLNKMAENLQGFFADKDIDLLCQGKKHDRSTMIKRFKSHDRCVLFGTDSFWQGVDVPGQALSNVIIAKLPFAVPSHPLIAGRVEQIKEKGGNPFFDYQLPWAVIKFKQGFGRLIRSKTDTGIVVVLDSRIASKRYGQNFLSAIDKCRIEFVPAK